MDKDKRKEYYEKLIISEQNREDLYKNPLEDSDFIKVLNS